MTAKKDKAAPTPEEAAAAVSEDGDKVDLTEVTLPNGVKLKLSKSPPFALQQAVANLDPPKIPIWKSPKGRDEENPNDPDYVKALLHYQGQTGQAALNALLLFGVEVIFVPKGMQRIEDTTWSEELAFLDMPVPDDPESRVRKLMWLKVVAIDTEEFLEEVSNKLFALQGLSEEDIAAAIDTFRGGAEGRSNNGRPTDAGSGDGDNVPANDPRPRRARRGAGRRKA
jgi:hypothetical protein